MMNKNNYQGALQQPINTGFDAASTTNDVIKGHDLNGKTAIVTCGYAGIGLETVKALVSAGATVIVAARNIEKAKKSLDGISNVEVETMDLMDPKSIDLFAEKFLASGRNLDLLINNAGIMWVPLQRDARGYESQLSTNYLGHFQLTARLLFHPGDIIFHLSYLKIPIFLIENSNRFQLMDNLKLPISFFLWS